MKVRSPIRFAALRHSGGARSPVGGGDDDDDGVGDAVWWGDGGARGVSGVSDVRVARLHPRGRESVGCQARREPVVPPCAARPPSSSSLHLGRGRSRSASPPLFSPSPSVFLSLSPPLSRARTLYLSLSLSLALSLSLSLLLSLRPRARSLLRESARERRAGGESRRCAPLPTATLRATHRIASLRSAPLRSVVCHRWTLDAAACADVGADGTSNDRRRDSMTHRAHGAIGEICAAYVTSSRENRDTTDGSRADSKSE